MKFLSTAVLILLTLGLIRASSTSTEKGKSSGLLQDTTTRVEAVKLEGDSALASTPLRKAIDEGDLETAVRLCRQDWSSVTRNSNTQSKQRTLISLSSLSSKLDWNIGRAQSLHFTQKDQKRPVKKYLGKSTLVKAVWSMQQHPLN